MFSNFVVFYSEQINITGISPGIRFAQNGENHPASKHQ